MTWGLRHVSVDVGGEPALIDVDLGVDAGDIVAVVGGDGAGKTTVARTLVGLVRPHSGEVRRPEATKVGYLPAMSGVWPDLTVAENLGFVADAHRLARSDRRRRIDELLGVTALDDAASRLGSELSGGMRQKLGVAMALLARPDLLVLDEPSTGVDPVSRIELWRLMTTTAIEGAAVVLTTSYLDEAERAGSITALDSGRVMASGSLAEIAGAVRGVIVDQRSSDGNAWRRGRQWRSWRSDGTTPDGASRIEPDLTDLLVAATLAAEARS
jgi:ABC-2 type transport system ATP-binding protein